MPGNARRGRPQGKCHRKQTAAAAAAVRVKGWGKSPPRDRQRKRHGKPHREQNRIGAARIPQGIRSFPDQPPGLVARGVRQRASQMNGRHVRQQCRAIQNPAYRPADTFSLPVSMIRPAPAGARRAPRQVRNGRASPPTRLSRLRRQAFSIRRSGWVRESGRLRPSGGGATASVATFRGYWFPVFGCAETGTTAEERASRRSGCPPFPTPLLPRLSLPLEPKPRAGTGAADKLRLWASLWNHCASPSNPPRKTPNLLPCRMQAAGNSKLSLTVDN